MTASANRTAPRRLSRTVLAAFPVLLCVAAWARADDIPSLQPGLWQFQRTAGTAKFAATECIDPSEDLRQQHEAMVRMGCNVSAPLHSGTTYTYAAQCAIKLPSGAVTFSTTSVLTAQSETAYRVENTIVKQGVTTSETISGERVSDCVK